MGKSAMRKAAEHKASQEAEAAALKEGKTTEDQVAAAKVAAAAINVDPDARVEARLLYDYAPFGKCNDVVVMSVVELERAIDMGAADDDATAVAYAKTLKQNGGTE